MDIPSKVKVGGIWYKVKIVPAKKIDHKAARTVFDISTIFIGKELEINQKWVGLFHEIVHTINVEYTELASEFLAQAIFQVLVDNKILKVGGKK